MPNPPRWTEPDAAAAVGCDDIGGAGIDGDGDRWLCPGDDGPEDDGTELARPSLMVNRGPPPPAAIKLNRLRGAERCGEVQRGVERE